MFQTKIWHDAFRIQKQIHPKESMNRRPLKPLILLVLASFLTACSLLAGTPEERGWKRAVKVAASIREPKFRDYQCSILDFGAVEGRQNGSGDCINKAILACQEKGGGTVVVPKGVFYTGPIDLKSNVCLHLEDSAVLKFSTNPEDFTPFVVTRWEGWDCINFHPLIYAYRQTNVAVTGHGILDGQADETNWWPWKGRVEFGWKPNVVCQEWNGSKVAGRNRLAAMENNEIPLNERIMTQEDRLRPPFLQFYQCQNVLIEDVHIIRAPFWLIHPLLSRNVTVRGVQMESQGPNNDGCDPESSSNVLIENCQFNTGDDCIAIKSGRNKDGKRWNTPSQNIIIRHCTMKNGHGGVVAGSEITGGCRNIWAEDCIMDSPYLDRMLRIKSNPVRGGRIENIYLRNIRVGQCAEAIFRIEMKYEGLTKGPNMPEISHVYLRNITSGKCDRALWIDGFDSMNNVRDIQISDCSFRNVAQPNIIIGAENVVFNKVKINDILVK
jgi:polygalacturonase